MALPRIDLTIPHIGAVCKVFGMHVIGHFQCNCRADNPPLLLPGIESAVSCERCGKLYAITRVSFDRREAQQATLSIGVIAHVPPTAEPTKKTDS